MTKLLFFILLNLCFTVAFSQVKNLKNSSPYPTKYISTSDQLLTLKTVSIAPAFDNVGGIYKKTAEDTLKELIKNDTFWSYQNFSFSTAEEEKNYRIDLVEENPKYVLSLLQNIKADALFSLSVMKSAQGFQMRLTLYTNDQGFPLIQEVYEDPTTFETSKFKDILTSSYQQIKSRLPFKALIASRRGQTVTLNMGQDAQLKIGDTLSVVQILKINRHPKLNFMVGVEKEIIGQVVITKVEEKLSFGEIKFEKEAGVIEKNAKLLPKSVVQYEVSNPSQSSSGSSEQPTEWVPPEPPQFGKFYFLGGFSNYNLSNTLQSNQSYDSGNSFAPTFILGSELWLTPEYFAHFSVGHQFFKGSNSLSGSYPSNLNYTIAEYQISGGYKFLIDGHFWGPHLTAALGYTTHNTSVSDSSPTAFSSVELSGFHLQIGGYFPLTTENDFALGAQGLFLVTSRLNETPVDSGPSSNNFSKFDFYGVYAMTTQMNFKAQLSFSNLNANFDSTGNRNPQARSMNETETSYLAGLEFQF